MTTPGSVRVFYRDKKTSSGRIKGDEIVLYISSRLPAEVAQEHIRVLTERLLVQAARRPAPALPPGLTPCEVRDHTALARWADELNRRFYNFHPLNGVSFKKQKMRWGSCSGRTRSIYISDRLRGGPYELLEYVLIHELCHLKEMNHGPRFWKLVAVGCPDWVERRRLLHRYGRWLESQGL